MADLRASLGELSLTGVEETDVEIGRGAYGVVKEYIICGGLRCAGKHIHAELATADSEQSVEIADKFEEECRLLSKQHHPNIVLFMGVHFKEGQDFPVLLMEQLPMSLDGALTRYPKLPAYVKNSILYDVACGLSFLHSKAPPILHRDLTSRNILLSDNFHAKIADLGVARIIHKASLNLKLTKLPGNASFMPPEAYPDDPEYGTALDMFSYGVLILNVVTQRWPNPDAQINKERVAVAEVVRRKNDLDEMEEAHPLREFTVRCLSDIATDRHSAVEAVQKLALEKKATKKPFDNTMEMKLYMDGLSREMTDMKSSNLSQQESLENLEKEATEAKNAKLRLQMENSMLSEEIATARNDNRRLHEDTTAKDNLLGRKNDVIEAMKVEKKALQEWADTKVILLEPTASFQWTRCSPLPHPRKHVQAIAVSNKVYIGSGYTAEEDNAYEVYCYIPETDQWGESATSRTSYFAMASFDDKVVLIGGKERDKSFSKRVQVLSPDGKFEDHQDIPELPASRAGCVATSLAYGIVVAGGYSDANNRDRVATVEVFDKFSKMWYRVPDLPKTCAELKAAIALGNQWYLLGGSNQRNEVFTISLRKIEDTVKRQRAVSHTAANDEAAPQDSAGDGWKRVARLPYDFCFVSIFGGSLLAMGGEKEKWFGGFEYSDNIRVYNSNKDEWVHIADLPTGLSKSTALVLPTGEMLVIGGRGTAGRELDAVHRCRITCPM